jgi:radical SAM protein with 4Fe4S-binding SPASM domain
VIAEVPLKERRARNRKLQDVAIESGSVKLAAMPTRVWFALTGRCNLACVHCPRIAGVSSDVDMDRALYARVRDEVLVYAEEIDFGGNNLGEQMIHPDFFAALADLRSANCNVLLTTNGTKLDANTAMQLAERGVRLRISVEGIGKTYEQVRRVSWDKLMSGLREFQKAAHDHPEARASLEFAMTAFADNVHQIPELVAQAKELGADRVLVQHLLPKNEDQKLQSLYFHRKTANDTFAQTEKLAGELGVSVSLPKPMNCGSVSLKKAVEEPAPQRLSPCYLPWTSVNVLENGDVLPCCVAGGSLIMGNLKKNSFEAIWNGPAYQRLRKTVNSDKPHPDCAACSMRGGSATEETFGVLLNRHSIAGWVKSSVKRYLLRTKRKKLLARLVQTRDTVQRILARV